MRKYNRVLENRTRDFLIEESHTEQLETGLETRLQLQKREEEDLVWREYNSERGARLSIDDYKELHKEHRELVEALNRLYRKESQWGCNDEDEMGWEEDDGECCDNYNLRELEFENEERERRELEFDKEQREMEKLEDEYGYNEYVDDDY